MAVNYSDNRVTATNNNYGVRVASVRLLAADVALLGANASVKVVLPANTTILGFVLWKKTQLSGGGITAATLSIGVPGAATQFVNAADVLTPAAGTQDFLVSANTHQNYSAPAGGDISLLFTGTATTGNPTAGELYVDVLYVS